MTLKKTIYLFPALLLYFAHIGIIYKMGQESVMINNIERMN
jgi:hypothetical protein